WRITHFGIAGQISKQNDFIKTGHASFLAKLLFGRDLFRRLFRLFTFWLQPLKMLAINFGIEFEFRPQFRNQLRIGFENEIYIIIDSNPLWPPVPPLGRIRMRPTGRARSSKTTRISGVAIL